MATRHLQLFRNTTPFESYEAAVAYYASTLNEHINNQYAAGLLS